MGDHLCSRVRVIIKSKSHGRASIYRYRRGFLTKGVFEKQDFSYLSWMERGPLSPRFPPDPPQRGVTAEVVTLNMLISEKTKKCVFRKKS